MAYNAFYKTDKELYFRCEDIVYIHSGLPEPLTKRQFPHTFLYVESELKEGRFQKNNIMGKNLYVNFWKEQMPFVKNTLATGKSNRKEINIAELQACSQNGDRQTLGFRVTVEDGIASTNTNSAIARDLCAVINNVLNKEEISKRKFVINLVQGNRLNITLY